MKKSAVDRFVANMRKLCDGEIIDFYESSVDSMFEYVCSALLSELRDDSVWYDGTANLRLVSNVDNILTFEGDMNVMYSQSKHWLEPFRARVHTVANDDNFVVEIVCDKYQSSGRIYTMFEDDLISDT